ncbi:MAG TPA: AMP-binding protein [Longimicrobiales bacterium]|nr:AMP-binding protein [Longimicrobiales bacterium]
MGGSTQPARLCRRALRVLLGSSQTGSLSGLPHGKGLNIAYETVDRHAKSAHPTRVAMRFLLREEGVRDITYYELYQLTNRFANALRNLGVQPGSSVFVLAGRIPELYVAALGALKHRCVFSPLFSAFGPEPVQARLHLGGGRVLSLTKRGFTTQCHMSAKVEGTK